MSVGSDDVLHLTLLGEAALNAECAIFVANEEGEIVAANDAMCKIAGLDRKALAAKPLDDVVPPGSYQAIATRVASLPYLLGFVMPQPGALRGRPRRR